MADDDGSKGRLRIPPRAIVALALLAVLLTFVFRNRRRVKVDFLVADTEVRLWVALAVAAVAGLVAGYLGGVARRRNND